MIKTLAAKNFKAIPYLETSQLMQSHPNGLAFSTDKPNVIVGPNGAGKSACLQALALLTLSYFAGISALDDNFTARWRAGDTFWEQTGYSWEREYTFLPGLIREDDHGPALFYRPNHIPGNDKSVAASIMCGYLDEARAYGEMTRHRSSGQQCTALLDRLRRALTGDLSEVKYGYMNWGHGKEPRDLGTSRYVCDFEQHAEALKKRLAVVPINAKPVLLMDEPEQSLDAKAELLLWKQIAQVDTKRVQVIVATHSLYPLLHADRFNLIEAVPGYGEEVRQLL